MVSCCGACAQLHGARQNAFRNFRAVLAERERKSRLEAELRRFEAALLWSALARPQRANVSENDDLSGAKEVASDVNDLLTWQPRWRIVGKDAYAVYDNPWADVSSGGEGGSELEFETPPFGSFLIFLGAEKERARRERMEMFLEQGMTSAESGNVGVSPSPETSPPEREAFPGGVQKDGWSCLFSPPSAKSSSLQNWMTESFTPPGGTRQPGVEGGYSESSKMGGTGWRESWGGEEEAWDPWRSLFSPTRGGGAGGHVAKGPPRKGRKVDIKKNEPKARTAEFHRGWLGDAPGRTLARIPHADGRSGRNGRSNGPPDEGRLHVPTAPSLMQPPKKLPDWLAEKLGRPKKPHWR
ncbi:hypothetical protein KFL_001880030 [Klebsormidium nitens]|uniref:Uncharacterized protein n=1 Tax=Klebsormidium nitens TaxID=105231 RepID=A0A1Y1I4Q9_KLENI|nr:hypothetical protein KFL_001880030 [Klebsormidium nitens]|eukprot:GAQ84409.1 hypothetical protein KFL_001880030 [Klebsormidium nitens]